MKTRAAINNLPFAGAKKNTSGGQERILQGVKTQASDETNPTKEFKIYATIFSHISGILTSSNT